MRTELRVFRNGRVWLALGVIALTQAMVFATFSYLAPLLTTTDGLPSSWVPLVLVLFGTGAVIGILAGGKLADARPFSTLYGSLGLAVAALIALAVTSDAVVAVVAVLVLGAAAFAANPALNVRAYSVAGGSSTLVGASTTSGFNVGNTAGPWVGGVAINAGLGFPSVAWVSVGLGGLALAALDVRPAPAAFRRRPRSPLGALLQGAGNPAGRAVKRRTAPAKNSREPFAVRERAQMPSAWKPPSTMTIEPVVAGNQSDSSAHRVLATGVGSEVSQPSGAALVPAVLQSPKPGIDLAAMVLHRAGGDQVDPDPLRARDPAPGNGSPTPARPSPRPSSCRPARPAGVEVHADDRRRRGRSAAAPPRPAT